GGGRAGHEAAGGHLQEDRQGLAARADVAGLEAEVLPELMLDGEVVVVGVRRLEIGPPADDGQRGREQRRTARHRAQRVGQRDGRRRVQLQDRKSTRLNSSHGGISYAVFCLKKKQRSSREQRGVVEEERILSRTRSTADSNFDDDRSMRLAGTSKATTATARQTYGPKELTWP